MTSIRIKFRPSKVDGREGSIFFQLIHRKIVRQIPSSCKIFPDEWDNEIASIKINPLSPRKETLREIAGRLSFEMERLNRIIKQLEINAPSFSLEKVAEAFLRYMKEYSLFNYMDSVACRLLRKGQRRTSETYKVTLTNFRKFREGKDICIDCITPEVMEEYEAWNRRRGLVPNTTSFYLRILRAVYNRAVEEGATPDRTPFRHVYTGVDKTVKRALSVADIRKLDKIDLTLSRSMEYARDMFMLSFMLRGMSLIDMAYLRKTDRIGGYIHYRRRKTGQLLTIQWTREMENILKKYPDNESDYLLPIIRNKNVNDFFTYRNMGYLINRNLRMVGNKLGLPHHLTLYVARHSWASIAKAKGVPVSVISEGMGHNRESTTRIYLAGLDTHTIDKANKLILKLFNSREEKK